MRLAEWHREPGEAHFTEGELDLEAPEELAIAEIDEETILEEELDNEDLLEQDVDEDTLEETLDDLVHGDDTEVGDLDDDTGVEDLDDDADGALGTDASPALGAKEERDPDEDVDAGELEESLDLVLLERMALLDHDGIGGRDQATTTGAAVLLRMRLDTVDLVDVAPRSSDEFVCRSCFLVRKRVQLVDPGAMVCRDCSS